VFQMMTRRVTYQSSVRYIPLSVSKYSSPLIFILILIIYFINKFKVKKKIKCIIKLLYVINHIIFDFL
jgi:hypothetical protein